MEYAAIARVKMNSLLIFIHICILLQYSKTIDGQRVSIVTRPEDVTAKLRSNALLNCEVNGTIVHNGDSLEWKEHTSNQAGTAIYKMPPGSVLFGDQKYEIEGQYNLRIIDVGFDDARFYTCSIFSQPRPFGANLVVLDTPNLRKPEDLFEGENIPLSCIADYSKPSNTNPRHEPYARLTIDGKEIENVDRQEFLRIIRSSVQLEGNLTAISAYNGKNLSCEIFTLEPAFSLSINWTLNIKYPVKDVEIKPRKTTYDIGDTLSCVADGNPPPNVFWIPGDGPYIPEGPSTTPINRGTTQGVIIDTTREATLKITKDMGASGTWTCVAASPGQPRTVEETIMFSIDQDSEGNRQQGSSSTRLQFFMTMQTCIIAMFITIHVFLF